MTHVQIADPGVGRVSSGLARHLDDEGLQDAAAALVSQEGKGQSMLAARSQG